MSNRIWLLLLSIAILGACGPSKPAALESPAFEITGPALLFFYTEN